MQASDWIANAKPNVEAENDYCTWTEFVLVEFDDKSHGIAQWVEYKKDVYHFGNHWKDQSKCWYLDSRIAGWQYIIPMEAK